MEKRSCNFFSVLVFVLLLSDANGQVKKSGKNEAYLQYNKVQQSLAKGWNTWNTHSVLSHVHLPDYLNIHIMLHDTEANVTLVDAFIGKRGSDVEVVHPLAHTLNGRYTALTIDWHGAKFMVESSALDSDQLILVTPLKPKSNIEVWISPSILWGGHGRIFLNNDKWDCYFPLNHTEIFFYGEQIKKLQPPESNTIISNVSYNPLAICTGHSRSAKEISEHINKAKEETQKKFANLQTSQDVYDAMQTVLGWNVIYEPSLRKVITPVSRIWNVERGGYVLFCWDTFFASYMLASMDKNLAYANIIEVCSVIDILGFVPNHNSGCDISRDRSQPPIGSMTVKALYDHFKDEWLLETLFDKLLKWNRWWPNHRNNKNYLSWGTTPYKGIEENIYKADPLLRAEWESGLDNSPMYDSVPMNMMHTNSMELADVGLMSLYISDCNALADIAHIIKRPKEEAELQQRAGKYARQLETLWDDKTGIYLNKRTDINTFSYRLTPTNFYPLLTGIVPEKKALRMVNEHYFNPKEFYGEYMMPSVSRSDPAFEDNDYWRGRIWAPMNFLVYLGLQHYPTLINARKDLVEKSENLLMKEWKNNRYVFENYNSNTGEGDDVKNSDKFYHWGALLGYIKILEEKSIKK